MTLTQTPPAASASTAAFPPGRLFIGGQWQDASDGGRMDVIAPATGQKLTDVAKATTTDVDAAVAAARAAFDSGVWSGLSSRERARILQRAYTLMRERSEELAHAESTNVGKPITFARVVDVNNAAELYEYYASLGHHLDGAVRETTGNTHVYVKKEPIGVVAAITPFNFPLILSSTKIAPALIAGNTIVHKPASDTPLSRAADGADPARRPGVPDGVFNVVTGSGAAIGDHLVAHPGVDKVAFTGSTEIGAHAAQLAGRTLKPFTAELGRQRRQHPLRGCGPEHGDAHRHRRVRVQLRAVLHGGTAAPRRTSDLRHRARHPRRRSAARAVRRHHGSRDGDRPARERDPAREGRGDGRPCEGGRRPGGHRRREGRARRLLLPPDGARRSRRRRRGRVGGGLRPGAHGTALRHRGGGDPARQLARATGSRAASRPPIWRRRTASPRSSRRGSPG